MKRPTLVGAVKFFAKTLLAVAGLCVLLVATEVISARIVGYPIILHFLLHELPFRGERFDAEKWDEAGSCKGILSDFACVEKGASCLRGPMGHDLLQNHLKPKITTREEVTQMLGEKDHDANISGETCPAYILGMCSGFGFDYDSLYVCFDQDQRVSQAGHYQG